jgi:hypothetical protein
MVSTKLSLFHSGYGNHRHCSLCFTSLHPLYEWLFNEILWRFLCFSLYFNTCFPRWRLFICTPPCVWIREPESWDFREGVFSCLGSVFSVALPSSLPMDEWAVCKRNGDCCCLLFEFHEYKQRQNINPILNCSCRHLCTAFHSTQHALCRCFIEMLHLIVIE